jgi:tetratricopeptide (TPR) repeat protein
MPTQPQSQLELSAWIDAVETAVHAGDLFLAKTQAKECKALFPTATTPNYLLAVVCFYTNEYREGIGYADECLNQYRSLGEEMSSAYLKSVCLRARLMWGVGERTESADLLLHSGRSHRYGEAFVFLAMQAQQTCDWNKVVAYCAEGITIAPHTAMLWFCQAQAHYMLEHLAEARASLASLLTIDNNYLEGLKLITRIELKDGRYVESLKFATRLLELDDRNEVALSASFFSNLHMGHWNEAERLLPTLLAVNPEDRDNYLQALKLSKTECGNADFNFNRDSLFNSGLLAYRQQKYEQARSLFQTAIGLDSKPDAQLTLWIASCSTKLGNYIDAVKHYEQIDCTQCQPEDLLSVYSGWGNALMNSDRPELALPLLERALELKPMDIDVCLGLACCYGAVNKLKEAIELSGKALELAPSSTDTGIVHITYLLRDNQVDRACKAAGRLMAVAPLDPKAHYVSGLVYLRLGKFLPAMNFATYFLKQHPGEQMAVDFYLEVSHALDQDLGICRARH